MGKAKKRNFQNCINTGTGGVMGALPSSCSRKDAVEYVIKNIKDNNFGAQTKDVISLFGITAEELAEAGASYEDLVALKAVLI